MGFACFVKIANIPGESTNAKHKGQIEAISYNHGISQQLSGGRSTGGGPSGGRSIHNDFSFVHQIDKASPKLSFFCCTGEEVGKVEVELCRQTKDETCFMKYTMEGVIVSSVQPGGAADSDGIPLEQVSLNYAKIAISYTETDKETGKPGGKVEMKWDVTKNEGS